MRYPLARGNPRAYSNLMSNDDIKSRFEKAQANVRRVEAAGLSKSSQNKAWREYFAAEDALKATGYWR